MKKKIGLVTKLICMLLSFMFVISVFNIIPTNIANADIEEKDQIIDIHERNLVFTPIENMFESFAEKFNENVESINKYESEIQDSGFYVDSDYDFRDFQTEIEKLMKKSDTSVVNELEKRIDNYYIMLGNSTNEDENTQLQNLINTTTNQLNVYKNKLDSQGNIKPFGSASKDFLSVVIPMALAYFDFMGYELSAELMTHAVDLASSGIYTPDTTYSPINYEIVLASLFTYDVLNSSTMIKNAAFPNITHNLLSSKYVNESDLFLAIHGFSYEKLDNNGKIRITDPYNFDSRGHGVIIDFLSDIFEDLMNAGYLTTYEIDFTINVYNYLYISHPWKNDNKWTIQITNFTGKEIDVMYNSKMCFKNDAKYWENLKDVKVFSMPKNCSTRIDIEENFFADYVAISYINEDNLRYITYANELSMDSPYGDKTRTEYGTLIPDTYLNRSGSTVPCFAATEDVSNMGKRGADWVVKIRNPFEKSATIIYNTKLCFENDALRWRNLNNIASFTLGSKGVEYVLVSGNLAADSIAVRITNDKDDRIICGNELNDLCHIRVQRFSYLRITKLGKSGGYNFRIYNPYNEKIQVDYNLKLCFESDAEKWSGLKDVEHYQLSGHLDFDKTIKSNFFANTAVFSYVINGRRLITYAYNLDNNITVKYNYL